MTLLGIGIDPGSTDANPLGFALIDFEDNELFEGRLIRTEAFKPQIDKTHPKLKRSSMETFFDRCDSVAGFLDQELERFAHNADIRIAFIAYEFMQGGGIWTATMRLSHIGGIVRGLGRHYTIPVFTVSPDDAKYALTQQGRFVKKGDKKADKQQMMHAVEQRFHVSVSKDEADAVGICVAGHTAFMVDQQQRIAREQWEG